MIQEIVITPYRDAFHKPVVDLILSVQQEYNVPVTYEDQPDLKNIPAGYQTGSGNLWVALDNENVVGTIALIDRSQQTGVLRKMFVLADYRGAAKGVAKRLLDTLLQWAGDHGIRHIFLGTNTLLPAASRFYEKHGFHLVGNDALPPHVEAIRMAVDNRHYHKELAA